jgi:radical SAM superfamily enzyme YgiQ (UPF0313 family)
MMEAGRRVRVTLVGLGSPAHYALWNDLSCETLAGDLRGHFGSEVIVDIEHAAALAEIPNVVSRLDKTNPEIIGISLQPGSLALCDALIEGLPQVWKGKPEGFVVMGNQIPTYFPRQIVSRYSACEKLIVVRGEGEIAFRGIVEFARGRTRLEDIESIAYLDRSSNTILVNRWVTPPLTRLLHLPAFDTCKSIVERGGNVMVQASRGCSWGRCSYCTRRSFRNGLDWEGFGIDRVLANLEALIRIGATEVEFCDDEFFGGREPGNLSRIQSLIDGIASLPGKLTFRIFTRPDIVFRKGDDEINRTILSLFTQLKQVGLSRVYLGLESGCRSQLSRYAKPCSLAQNEEAIRIIRKLGIGLDIGFIMFDPETTVEEMMTNIEFFRKHELQKSNQWPFRPLVLNQGCHLQERIDEVKLIVDAMDIDHICYKYVYRDDRIQYISDILAQISPPDGAYARLIYALKVRSKRYFDPQKRTAETNRAQDLIERHCDIFLDLMEGLGKAMNRHPSQRDEEIRSVVNTAVNRITDLVAAIKASLLAKEIEDIDAYLINQLRAWDRNVVKPISLEKAHSQDDMG